MSVAKFFEPRLWLIGWSVIGAAFLVYVIMAASVKPAGGEAPSALNGDTALLVGEMADFAYAYPPRGAPPTSFLHDGEQLTLSAFRGKTVLVNFWATFCAPCLTELPSLDALQAELGGDRFEVVAIASDPSGPENAQQFLDRLRIQNLALYADPTLQFASATGGIEVLPISILCDADGREVGRLIVQADWSSPEALTLIRSAMP